MIQLIIYAVIAAAVAGFAYKAWDGFKDNIAAPYVQKQIEADKVILDKAERNAKAAEAERDGAVADTMACVMASAKQSTEIGRWKDAADRNAVAARAAKEQAQREATAAAPKIADLQARAAAAPKLMACEDELSKARDVLRDALRQRRGITTAPVPPSDPVRALGITPAAPK